MEVLENESRTRILKEFEIVRSTTMNLVKTLEADDYPVQILVYFAPSISKPIFVILIPSISASQYL